MKASPDGVVGECDAQGEHGLVSFFALQVAFHVEGLDEVVHVVGSLGRLESNEIENLIVMTHIAIVSQN